MYLELETLSNETLCDIAKKADEYREAALTVLVQRNESMIYKIAHSLENRGYTCDLFDMDDLMQTGRMAMIDAAQRFDPCMHAKFSTYCWNYIYGMMRNQASDNSSLVSASRETIRHYRDQAKKESDSHTIFETLSLNYPIKQEEGRPVEQIEFVVAGESTEKYMAHQYAIDAIKEVAKCLTVNERLAVFEYFGIGEGKFPKTVEEVTGGMNLTRQRVQQLKKSALKKMAAELKKEGYQLSDFM